MGLALESLIHESPLFHLRRESLGRAKVGLVRKDNEKFGLLPVRGVFNNPRRNLVRRSESIPWRIGLDCRRPRLC